MFSRVVQKQIDIEGDLVFLCGLFFPCAIQPNIPWLNGWWMSLTLFLNSILCVKDFFTFSSIIRRLPVCMESQFLVSFDVVSLFTNIPLDESISICADFLYRGPSIASLPFPEAVFIELMGIATKSVAFSFNETMFRQIEGVSMGSPLGPILANIFVEFYERRLFDKLPICGMLMILSFPSNLVAML